MAIGDPVCTSSDRIALAQAFHDFCKEQNKKSIYVMASESFTNETLDCFGGSALQIGHEIIIDSSMDTRSKPGRHPHQLRQKYRHALSNGVSACEYDDNNPEIEQALVKIANDWLSNRIRPQAYLLPLDIFAYRSNKRWFYAHKNNEIIGFLMLNRIDACQGWVLNGSIMLTSLAPNSTSEFLMLYALETLRNEGYKCLSIGTIVSSQVGRIEGFGWLSQILINYGMKSMRKILKLNDRERYWKKFQPHKESSFITFTSSRLGLQDLRALLRTFNVHI